MKPVRSLALYCTALALASCGSGSGSSSGGEPESIYADRVIAYAPVNSVPATEVQWPQFFDADLALGSPGGTFDTASLGYAPVPDTLGGWLVLGFGDGDGRRCIVDDAGDDFIVFENAFRTTDVADGAGTNSELATVEVSNDNATWHEFPHDINDALPPIDPARYSGFAGVIPRNEGGDRFDLADLGLPANFQACYIRFTDGGTRHEDYGNTQSDEWKSGADIDTVQALHSIAKPSQSP